ncbi:sensor histidine kinase [Rhizobium rhizosphaerae]|uniref:sensor histidine kinase n=1 Tax=Xaviernesmea rhizosphaerae TaxID=1672749 RepID=UPI001FDA3451|nr:HAMP domain-containing sensor histidine kinase [Xaviernesmea rhizosphaerae]
MSPLEGTATPPDAPGQEPAIASAQPRSARAGRSLAGRLTAIALVFVGATMAASAGVLWFAVSHVVREQVDQQLDVQITALKGALSFDAGGRPMLSSAFDNPPFDRPGWLWQIDTPGGRLISPPPRRPHPPRGRNDAEGPDRPSAEGAGMPVDPASPPDAPGDRGERPRRPIDLAMEDHAGPALYLRRQDAMVEGRSVTLIASAPAGALTVPARDALGWLLPLTLLLGLMLTLGTLLQVRIGLRPLRRLTDEIQAIERGARARLAPAQLRELQPLTAEINRLLDQNETRLAETRLHFANLAHGLKTPLASLTLALDRKKDPDGALGRLAERMEQRIRRHLALARKAAGAAGLGAATALAPVLADLLALLPRLHAERRVTADIAGMKDLFLRCEARDAEEILGNLLDNAFKWAAGAIAVTAAREGGMITLLIDDDGPGIAQERRAEVLRAGMRLDETVPGDGFGLSIAEELVTLYGGRLGLETSPLGGLRVRLTLPAAISGEAG